jgi:hypothetical protein
MTDNELMRNAGLQGSKNCPVRSVHFSGLSHWDRGPSEGGDRVKIQGSG